MSAWSRKGACSWSLGSTSKPTRKHFPPYVSFHKKYFWFNLSTDNFEQRTSKSYIERFTSQRSFLLWFVCFRELETIDLSPHWFEIHNELFLFFIQSMLYTFMYFITVGERCFWCFLLNYGINSCFGLAVENLIVFEAIISTLRK